MTTIFGWAGIVWILISTILSSTGLSNYRKRGSKTFTLSSSEARRSLAIFVLDALAILAVAMYSTMDGVISLSFAAWQVVDVPSSPYYLAIAAWVLTLPFVVDVWKATKGKLHITTTHVVVRSIVLALRLMLVMVMMFA